jgi:hypothetical protein
VNLTSNSYGKSICYIMDIYVPENYRRNGIGTYMMKLLFEQYGILQTGTGTKAGGMALMKSLGWTRCRESGDWYLRGNPKSLPK